MSGTLAVDSSVTDPEDLGKGDAGVYSLWMGRDRIAAKAEDNWPERGRKVRDRYRDERKNTPTTGARALHRFNILWSNVQTLLPVLYARTPKPAVQRRFLDKDPIGRLASILLERAIEYSLDAHDFDSVMLACVLDRLLPGRGQCRIIYTPTYGDPLQPAEAEADFDDVEAADASVANPGDDEANAPAPGAATPQSPMGTPGALEPEPLREVVYEQVTSKYEFWEDYRESPARTWAEVSWVRFKVYMTRAELKKRFGNKKAMKVALDYTPPGTTGPKGDTSAPPPDIFKQAIVYEFWDKSTRRVIWLAPGTPDLILDEKNDPLGLADFFPCPDPLLATTTTDKRTPVPDYAEYQDQADELDLLTARIDRLTRALAVKGVYAASEKASLQQLLNGDTENMMIPVEDWAMFAQQKGGLEGTVLWLPIKVIAETLIQLCDMRDRSKAIIYEITGIGDIIRGATQPMETATAQRLKASFATRRQQPEQKRVARFARDVIRLIGAVIAEHFSPQTISAITGYPQLEAVPELAPQPPQTVPAPPGAMGAPAGPGMAPGPPQPPQMGGNVTPFPGAPPQPQMIPNPAYADWEKMAHAKAMIEAKNAAARQQFAEAVDLIRKDGITGFRLDIESDSTIALDEAQDRTDRTEFISALLPLMQQVVPISQGNPAMAELAKELVMFGVRGFPVARSMEETIERAFDALAAMPPVPPKGAGKAGPDPQLEQAKIAADVKNTETQSSTDASIASGKEQTARMAILQKQQAAEGAQRIAAMKEEGEQQRSMVDLAIQESEADNRTQIAGHQAAAKAAGGQR